MIAGWSDWVASNQIITRNLRDIGIDSNVALEPDWGAWQPSAYATKFPTLLWQAASQGSPYGYFYSNLSQNAYVPPGQSGETTGNWEHFSDPKATKLLDQVEGDAERGEAASDRHAAAGDVPRRPADRAAVHRPALVDVQHRYFHCFSTAKNFFGDPIFTTFPDNILSFTRICPGGKVGP